MKIIAEINNKTKFSISKPWVEKIIRKTIERSSFRMLLQKNLLISVAFLDSEEISKINKQYRNVNSPTDVLSFSEHEDIAKLYNDDNEIFLGEILICPQYIIESAKENNVTFEFEMDYIFSHGILHLLGYDHGKEMFSIQNEIAKSN